MFCTNAIIKNSEKYAKVIKAAREASGSLTTMDGALSIVTKFWNNGYAEAAKELGFSKPSEFAKAFRKGANGSFHQSMFDTNSKGVRTLGVWKLVKVYDMDEEKAVRDAQGRITHPYLVDDFGAVITQNVWKEVKRWTPGLLFEVYVQSEYATMVDNINVGNEGIAPENAEYIAQRALDKLHAANAAAKTADELQQVLCLPAAAAEAEAAPVAAPAAEAEAAPVATTRKPATRRATTRKPATRKPATRRATAKAAA